MLSTAQASPRGRQMAADRIPLIDPYEPMGNGGYDNINGDLIVYKDLRITNPDGYTYVVKEHIGSGQFGQVYMVALQSRNRTQYFAMKISKSYPDAHSQFQYETQVLEYLKMYLSESDRDKISVIDSSFIYANHSCIVMELLGDSMYSELSSRQFTGMSLPDIQNVLFCTLNALYSLSSLNLMHGDVKPENIVRSKSSKKEYKLIDFGSTMWVGDCQIDYFQSRYYRAPEILLKLRYDSKVDVWSLGCVAAELMLGLPLLPAQTELHLVSLMRKTIGPFTRAMSDSSPRNTVMFMPDGEVKSPEILCAENGEDWATTFEHYFVKTKLKNIIRSYECSETGNDTMENRMVFLDLLEQMLKIDPTERISAEMALQHPFMHIEFAEEES